VHKASKYIKITRSS